MFRKLMSIAAAAGLGALIAASPANATTFEDNFGNLPMNASITYSPLDLYSLEEIQIDGKVSGAGSLTVNTYSSKVPLTGNAAANILIGATGGATSVTGSWGSNIINFALSNGSWVGKISTLFSTAGFAGNQALVIHWTGATRDQLSLSIAPSAVPLPGAAILLLTGLAGIGALGSRNKKAAAKAA